MIPFNKPHLTGNELKYIQEAVNTGKISGDGIFTKRCHSFFEKRYNFQKCLLTSSCTDALEMTALLLNIKEGDEIILPAFTFVSTANAFALRGAKLVFIDSRPDHPGMQESSIENHITPRTKAIVVVHYAGVACDMDIIMELSIKYNLPVIEDAAQAIDSFYKGKPLGSMGHFSTFSFHETKNIQCGEGGMIVINDAIYNDRSEIIREKGTNRSAFFRGEADKYGWVDLGSSFLPSDITAAFLFAQLEKLDSIQYRRKEIWNRYMTELKSIENDGLIRLPFIPEFATNNGHIFYILFPNIERRTDFIDFLKVNKVLAVFHYLSLNQSAYYSSKYITNTLQFSDYYTNTLVRLPLFVDMSNEEIDKIISTIKLFFKTITK